MVVYREQPTLPAPASQTSFVGWMHKNLFSNWVNSIITLALLYFFSTATVEPDSVGFPEIRLGW